MEAAPGRGAELVAEPNPQVVDARSASAVLPADQASISGR